MDEDTRSIIFNLLQAQEEITKLLQDIHSGTVNYGSDRPYNISSWITRINDAWDRKAFA